MVEYGRGGAHGRLVSQLGTTIVTVSWDRTTTSTRSRSSGGSA